MSEKIGPRTKKFCRNHPQMRQLFLCSTCHETLTAEGNDKDDCPKFCQCEELELYTHGATCGVVDGCDNHYREQLMKKNYRVKINEIHISTWDVEANSEQDAVDKALGGDGEMIDCQYSYTPDNDYVHCVTKEL